MHAAGHQTLGWLGNKNNSQSRGLLALAVRNPTHRPPNVPRTQEDTNRVVQAVVRKRKPNLDRGLAACRLGLELTPLLVDRPRPRVPQVPLFFIRCTAAFPVSGAEAAQTHL